MNGTGGEQQRDGEESIRRLIASWMSEPVSTPPAETGSGADCRPATSLPLGTGLAVPPAAAERVITVAHRLAVEGLGPGPLPEADPALRLLAEALVLDEHPSAGDWTPAERATALDWITLLIHRFGEDGVQLLVAALS